MTKLLGIMAAVLLLAGCMFPQGWHWPRTGISTTETHVYWQDDTAGQHDVLAWTGGYYNGHPELAIRLVNTCPADVNCVVWRTSVNGGGATSISFDNRRHLLHATVTLDRGVTNDFGGRLIVFHEACHAFGGGYGDGIHALCNWEWRSLIFAEISRVYHDDPG